MTRRWRCAVLSVVKHAYVPRGVAAHPRFELVVVADDADQPQDVEIAGRVVVEEGAVVEAVQPLRREVVGPVAAGLLAREQLRVHHGLDELGAVETLGQGGELGRAVEAGRLHGARDEIPIFCFGHGGRGRAT